MSKRSTIAEKYRSEGLEVEADVVAAFDEHPDYVTRDLTDIPPKNTHDFKDTLSATPLHWFGLYPAESYQPGVRAIQFGIAPPELVRPSQELLMEVVARNGADATMRPYSYLGGTMVKEARDAGHNVFAAIEINALDMNDEEILLFSRLAISRALLKTRSTFSQINKSVDASHMPNWTKRLAAASSTRDWKIAELMAWSAFASAGVSEARPIPLHPPSGPASS